MGGKTRWGLWVLILGIGMGCSRGPAAAPSTAPSSAPSSGTIWGERAGPGGGRYAVPPGWTAWVGEEIQRLPSLPEVLQVWVTYTPDLVFVARREKAMILVAERPAHLSPEEDPQFWKDTEQSFQYVLSGWAETLDRELGGRFQVKIQRVERRERPGFLGAMFGTLEVLGARERIPVQYWTLLRPDRTFDVIGLGEAPVEEFIGRSRFPGTSR